MISRMKKGLSVLLADEMGLGKRINLFLFKRDLKTQTAVFAYYRKNGSNNCCDRALIICRVDRRPVPGGCASKHRR